MISPLGATALLTIGWLVAQGRRLPGWRVAGLVVGVLSLATVLLPDPRGFRVKHFANTNFAEPGFTRLDRVLDFTPGERDLQLELPVSVHWDGYWWVDTPGDALGLYMDAPGGSGEIVIDGVRVLTMTATDATRTASTAPQRGWHQVVVRVSLPATASGRVSAGRLVNNERVPFDFLTVAQKRLAGWQRTGYHALEIARMLVTYAIALWLGALVVWDLFNLYGIYRLSGSLVANRSVIVRVFALIAGIESLRFAWPYFLSGLHGVVGESTFGVMLVQRLFVWFVAWTIMHLAAQIYRANIWPAALAAGTIFSHAKVAPIFATLPGEAFLISLLAGLTIALVGAMREPTRRLQLMVMAGGTALLMSFMAIRNAQVAFAGGKVWHKSLFAFGYFEPYAPGSGSSFIYMLVSCAGFIGLWTVVRARTVPLGTAILPALIAFAQLAAVVIVDPKGEQLILPFHVMFAPYAAIALERLWTEFVSR